MWQLAAATMGSRPERPTVAFETCRCRAFSCTCAGSAHGLYFIYYILQTMNRSKQGMRERRTKQVQWVKEGSGPHLPPMQWNHIIGGLRMHAEAFSWKETTNKIHHLLVSLLLWTHGYHHPCTNKMPHWVSSFSLLWIERSAKSPVFCTVSILILGDTEF